MDYFINNEPYLRSKGSKLIQNKKNIDLVIFGDKDNKLAIKSIKTSIHVKGTSNKPEEHRQYCANNHEFVK